MKRTRTGNPEFPKESQNPNTQGAGENPKQGSAPQSIATQNPHLSRTICFLTGYGVFHISANTRKQPEDRWTVPQCGHCSTTSHNRRITARRLLQFRRKTIHGRRRTNAPNCGENHLFSHKATRHPQDPSWIIQPSNTPYAPKPAALTKPLILHISFMR